MRQHRSNPSDTAGCIGADIRLTESDDRPPEALQDGILRPVALHLRGQIVPVDSIGFDNQHGARNGEVNREILNRKLMLNHDVGAGKSAQEQRFEAGCARPCAPANLAGASPGTCTKAADKGIAHHADRSADFAGHRVRPALVVIPLRAGKRPGQRNAAGGRADMCAGFESRWWALNRYATDGAQRRDMRHVHRILRSGVLPATIPTTACPRATLSAVGVNRPSLKRIATLSTDEDNRHVALLQSVTVPRALIALRGFRMPQIIPNRRPA